MDCPICFDVVDEKINCVVTECGHKFHTSCLFKHSLINKFDCPLCRTVIVQENNEEDIEEEDDNESYYSEDIRLFECEHENHMLRGFRWLFLQQDREEENNVCEFDGNSMRITPVSLRRSTEEDPLFLEEDEEEDEEEEDNWHQTETESLRKQKMVEILAAKIQNRFSYEKLLHAYLYNNYVEDFCYLEFASIEMKLKNMLDPIIESTRRIISDENLIDV